MKPDRVAALIRFAGAALRADEAWPREARAFAAAHGAELARETLRTLTLFFGFPRMLHALDAAAEVLAAHGAPQQQPAEGEPAARGRESFARVYGPDAEPVFARLGALDPILREWVIEHAYGRGYRGPLLTLEERERLAVLALAASGCWKQCESHLRACFRLRVARARLRADAEAPGWLEADARERLIARLVEEA